MPEQLTASKKVYQQEEFSMKSKERQKCLSKTLVKKKGGRGGDSYMIITITKKTWLQTNVISNYTKIPTFEKSKLWFILPPQLGLGEQLYTRKLNPF